MRRILWVWCCAVAAVAFQVSPSRTIAQEALLDEDPFGSRAAGPTAAPKKVESEAGRIGDPFREVKGGNDGESDFCRCVGETGAANVAKIEQALRSPLHEAGLDFVDIPFEEVVGQLQEEYDIPIQIDTKALDDLGVGTDEPVTVNLRGISLRAALQLMLRDLGLTYIVRDEVLLITTPDEAEKQLTICVYDVRDLKHVSNPAGLKKLVDAIISCVATETWAENGGGEAEIRTLDPGLLVISQTQAVHEEVRRLLETIRRTYARPTPAAAATDGAMKAAGNSEASNVVTRSYVLTINQPADTEKSAKQIRDLITKLLPDEQWVGQLESGEPLVLTVLPDRVVLRHRESVHNQVEKLLTDSGIASTASGAGGGFGGGGGGGFFSVESARGE